MQVATQILEQLGGHRFAAMTGAKQFVGRLQAVFTEATGLDTHL